MKITVDWLKIELHVRSPSVRYTTRRLVMQKLQRKLSSRFGRRQSSDVRIDPSMLIYVHFIAVVDALK